MKLLILDFDGTLANTQPLIVQTMQQTLQAVGLPQRSREECARMIGLPLKQTFTELMPMSDEMGNRCEATYRELFARNNRPGTVPLFPGVKETLLELHRRGLILTIATSRYRQSLEAFLEEMGIREIISYIVTPQEVAHAKPAPDMVEAILQHYGLPREEALVVGDAKYDILMGKSAGVKTCAVTYGNGSREELSRAGAHYLIDSFSSLYKNLHIV